MILRKRDREALARHESWLKSLGVRLNVRRAALRGTPFPDLSTAPSPCTNGFGPTPKRELPAGAKSFPVGHLHKQGPQLITPGAIANGDLQWFGGKKS